MMMTMSKKVGIKRLMNESGPYKQWALQQRRDFMELRLDQDEEIRIMYEDISRRITQDIAAGNLNQFDAERLQVIKRQMKDRIDELNSQLTINLDRYIQGNIEVGSTYAKQVALDIVERAGIIRLNKPMVEQAFSKMNTNAVEAMWSRSRYGLTLNDHIWNKNENYRKNISTILTSGVATGEDCVTVARALEKYVKKGKKD